MRTFVILFALFVSGVAQAQTIAVIPKTKKAKPVDTFQAAFVPHSVIATLSVGLIDGYRQDFSVPAGFQKNNTTGFAPIYGRVEYAASQHFSLGLTLAYDGLYQNYYQLFTGNNGQEYKRYKTDQLEIYSAGVSAYYHFGNIIPVKRLDVFVGVGLLLSNQMHSALPQGDSSIKITERKVAPALKAGVRYYISNRSSLFADAGYDKQSIFSLGYSCRFMKRK